MTATIMCTYMYMYLCAMYMHLCITKCCSAVAVAAEANAPTLVPQGMCAMRVFSVCFRHKYQWLSNITEKVSLRNKITPKWHMLDDPVGE